MHPVMIVVGLICAFLYLEGSHTFPNILLAAPALVTAPAAVMKSGVYNNAIYFRKTETHEESPGFELPPPSQLLGNHDDGEFDSLFSFGVAGSNEDPDV